MLKPFDQVDRNKLWKILQEMGRTWHASWEIDMQVKKQQLELDMGQQTGSNLGEEYVKALKNWCFWIVVLEKTLESPLDCKEIKQINSKGKKTLNIHWKDWY